MVPLEKLYTTTAPYKSLGKRYAYRTPEPEKNYFFCSGSTET